MWWKVLLLVAAIVWIGGDWLVKLVNRPLWDKLQLPETLLLTAVSLGVLLYLARLVTERLPVFGMALWLGVALALLLGNLSAWRQYRAARRLRPME